jgi:hypothetical protein
MYLEGSRWSGGAAVDVHGSGRSTGGCCLAGQFEAQKSVACIFEAAGGLVVLLWMCTGAAEAQVGGTGFTCHMTGQLYCQPCQLLCST